MSQPSYETILFEVHFDRVATVTLNRPEAMNSFNRKMVEEFADLWKRVQETPEIHAVVLQAADGRAFSTGVDVKEPLAFDTDNVWSQADPGSKLAPKASGCWKPVVAAVHGLCAAGAFYWLNEADIIIASEDAQFFDPHVTYGQVAVIEMVGLSYRLPLGEVLRMALLGNDERISASTALRLGFLSEVVSRGELHGRARELAAIIAAKHSIATQGTVRAIWEALDQPRSIALSRALQYCQLGNPVSMSQVDRPSLMSKAKTFKVR